MPAYQYYREQKLKVTKEKLWDFISNPANLSKITPREMGFKITNNHLSNTMYEGQIITYIVRPLFGIPVEWVTEITHVVDLEYFVDEQRAGPYKIWHHEHRLVDCGDHIVMQDLITYKPPFGIIGSIFNRFFIRKTLDKIFDFREKALRDIFAIGAIPAQK